jgi:dihydroflavonol-4-reductase
MVNNDQIVVTGGSGHLGASIIQMLLNQGKSVRALYHRFKPEIEHKNLSWIQGNITQSESLEGFVENSHAIIHSAGLISVGEKNKEEVYDTNVGGTENVIQACLNKKIRLIYISSSTAVQEKPSNEIFNEDRAYKTEKDFTYPWTKAVAEQKVLKAVKSSNLDAIIIRPTAIVGPPDFQPSRFGQTIWDMAKGKLPAITTGGYNIIDVRDLSQTIINSITRGKKGEIYLAGGHYISLQQLAQAANPNRNPICISLAWLILLLPILNIYSRIFPLRWTITKESLMTLKHSPKKVDSSKAIENLGHEIRPISETINDLIQWFNKENNK